MEAFPRIERIGGLRPDRLHGHDEGVALEILVPGDHTSREGIALGDAIRDFLLTRADELGIDRVLAPARLSRRRQLRSRWSPAAAAPPTTSPICTSRRKSVATRDFTPRDHFRFDRYERTSPMHELGPGCGAPVVHHTIGGAR